VRGQGAAPDDNTGPGGDGGAPSDGGDDPDPSGPGADERPGTDTEIPEDLSPLGPPGSFAPAYLTPEPARIVVLELLIEDQPLRQESVDHLVGVLEAETGKVVRVSIGTAPPDDSWTGDELRRAAETSATEVQGDGQAVMRLLVVTGQFEGSEDALGVSVRGDAAAVFVDQVRAAGSPLTGSARIERAVTVHEAGHLLGLVDLYLQTGRQDATHPGHSSNEESVMFWAVESSLVGDILGGGPPTEFDAADRADLARIRAGE